MQYIVDFFLNIAEIYDIDFTKWLVTTLAFASFAFICFKLPRFLAVGVWQRFRNSEAKIDGFLYHEATANVLPELLRRTDFKIRAGILNPLFAIQMNAEPLKKMYSGPVTVFGESMSITLQSRSSGPKLMNLYLPRDTTNGDLRFSVGYMSGLNQDSDPWVVPCLLASRKLPSEIVRQVLQIIDGGILSKEKRSAIEHAINENALRSLPSNDLINHPWGTTTPQ